VTILITILHVICCFLLIVVILIQGGRGQGLSGPSFASGNVQSLFGTRAADVLTKATSIAAICFLFTCIGLDWIEAQKARSLLEGPRKVAPLDIQKIKDALEKVKTQAAQKEAAGPTATTAAVPAPTDDQAEKAARDAAGSLIPAEVPAAPEPAPPSDETKST
jgi:preprotein translocase subunit SecG